MDWFYITNSFVSSHLFLNLFIVFSILRWNNRYLFLTTDDRLNGIGGVRQATE